MKQSVQPILTYPEQHAVWLEVMGVTRWQSKIELGMSQDVVEPLNQTHAVQTVEPTEIKQNTLPEAILKSRYWIVGEQALSADEAYLLAGMMAAIKAGSNEVVYSYIDSSKEGASTQIQPSGLTIWSNITIQIITNINVDIPDTLKVLVLGNHLNEAGLQQQKNVWQLPSLMSLINEPLLKRDAWATLKNMLAHENN